VKYFGFQPNTKAVREITQKSHNFILYFSNPFVSGYVFDYQIDTKEKAAKLAALSVELPSYTSKKQNFKTLIIKTLCFY
jgi:hypothetical protein